MRSVKYVSKYVDIKWNMFACNPEYAEILIILFYKHIFLIFIPMLLLHLHLWPS